jgi:hypothetical protein
MHVANSASAGKLGRELCSPSPFENKIEKKEVKISRDMTFEEFEEINIIPSYDMGELEIYEERNQDFYKERLGTNMITKVICEICDTSKILVLPAKVLDKVFCDKCEEYSCVFEKTLSMDARYAQIQEDDE